MEIFSSFFTNEVQNVLLLTFLLPWSHRVIRQLQNFEYFILLIEFHSEV